MTKEVASKLETIKSLLLVSKSEMFADSKSESDDENTEFEMSMI